MIHVTTRGMCARDIDVELEALTLLVGPNGSHKSTIMNAIRIAALQYVPVLGKSEAATATLMSGREMEIKVALPAARMIRQTLTRGKSLSWEADCSWLSPKATPSEHRLEAQRLFGDDAISFVVGGEAHYLFPVDPNESRVDPYAGGGLALLHVNRDEDEGDDDTELALVLTGGLDIPMRTWWKYFAEAKFLIADESIFRLEGGVTWTY